MNADEGGRGVERRLDGELGRVELPKDEAPAVHGGHDALVEAVAGDAAHGPRQWRRGAFGQRVGGPVKARLQVEPVHVARIVADDGEVTARAHRHALKEIDNVYSQLARIKSAINSMLSLEIWVSRVNRVLHTEMKRLERFLGERGWHKKELEEAHFHDLGTFSRKESTNGT